MQNTFILTSEVFIIFTSSSTVQTYGLFNCDFLKKISKHVLYFQVKVVQGKLLNSKSRSWGGKARKGPAKARGYRYYGHEGRAIQAPCSTSDGVMSHMFPMDCGTWVFLDEWVQDFRTYLLWSAPQRQIDPNHSNPWVFILIFVKCRCPVFKSYQIYIPLPLTCP